MDKSAALARMAEVSTVDEVLALAEQLRLTMNYEQADYALGRINQTKNDAAELSGDTLEKVATELFKL